MQITWFKHKSEMTKVKNKNLQALIFSFWNLEDLRILANWGRRNSGLFPKRNII